MIAGVFLALLRFHPSGGVVTIEGYGSCARYRRQTA